MSAIITKGGSVLTIGYNHISSHPKAYFGCSFHAEYDAIRKGKGSLVGSKMYVYRFSLKNNILSPSKPCLECQKKICEAGIRSTFFLSDTNIITKEKFSTAPNN